MWAANENLGFGFWSSTSVKNQTSQHKPPTWTFFFLVDFFFFIYLFIHFIPFYVKIYALSLLTTYMMQAWMDLENDGSFMFKKKLKGLVVVPTDLGDKEKAYGLYVNDKIAVEVKKYFESHPLTH